MNKFPCRCKTIEEANDYGLYAANVQYLKDNPLGTYCGGEEDKCLTSTDVIEFLEMFVEDPFYLAFAEEGYQWNFEEQGEKAVQTIWLRFKKGTKIPDDYILKLNAKRGEITEYITDYLSSDKKKDATLEFLTHCFEWLVSENGGSLADQGGDPGDWMMFDSE